MADATEKDHWQKLLRQAAGGDEHAWTEIVESYMPRVYGLIRAQCQDSDLSAEIAQSTFCTVAAKLADYAELGKFEPWLFRIAMNRLRDEMRRRKRQAVTMGHDALAGLAGAGPAREAGARGLDPTDARALSRALEQLSEADRQIIHLRHMSGLSFKQIAEILDQPLGTVLARQHRALKKLRDLLADLDPGLRDPEAEP